MFARKFRLFDVSRENITFKFQGVTLNNLRSLSPHPPFVVTQEFTPDSHVRTKVPSVVLAS